MDTESRVAMALSRTTAELSQAVLCDQVSSFLNRRDEFLSVAQEQGSPLYLFDPDILRTRARQFTAAFRSCWPRVDVFFALKSNSYPGVAQVLIEEGLGLDVSSGVELQFALSTAAERIVFSGPGKTDQELELAVAHVDRVTILADSCNELQRIQAIAARLDRPVEVGIRLTVDDHGIWRKFGIPVTTLPDAFELSRSLSHVTLAGLQFHISWNLAADKQVAFIRRLGAVLDDLPAADRRTIRFIDVGGGFWPSDGEWMQWQATPQGTVEGAVGTDVIRPLNHYVRSSSAIEEFAVSIATALLRYLPIDINAVMCLEPGRWLCHESMHLLLRVIDCKAEDIVITDGGTNAIGWDRFELDYFPIINLTHPSLSEQPCLVAGSLCTPHDLWGYSYFGSTIAAGDLLLVPNQGAYTWSLRQDFIKAVPPVVWLKTEENIMPASSDNSQTSVPLTTKRQA